jgi:hypothetical protein
MPDGLFSALRAEPRGQQAVRNLPGIDRGDHDAGPTIDQLHDIVNGLNVPAVAFVTMIDVRPY